MMMADQSSQCSLPSEDSAVEFGMNFDELSMDIDDIWRIIDEDPDPSLPRSLEDLIKGLRLYVGDESTFISKAVDEIRREIKSTDQQTKATALQKLTYMHSIHGVDMSWAAFHDKDDDDNSSIDPDIALSYIDEKLQSVLGHFQKDFEGGVSGENLGAKFGGYGSFLPTYQRSPSILDQPRSPQRSQNQGTPRSPNHFVSEGPPQNSSTVSDPPSTQRNSTAGSRSGHTLHDSRVPCGYDSARPCFSAQESNKFPVKHEVSMNKSHKPTDQRKFKLRIRVGSDKTA